MCYLYARRADACPDVDGRSQTPNVSAITAVGASRVLRACPGKPCASHRLFRGRVKHEPVPEGTATRRIDEKVRDVERAGHTDRPKSRIQSLEEDEVLVDRAQLDSVNAVGIRGYR